MKHIGLWICLWGLLAIVGLIAHDVKHLSERVAVLEGKK